MSLVTWKEFLRTRFSRDDLLWFFLTPFTVISTLSFCHKEPVRCADQTEILLSSFVASVCREDSGSERFSDQLNRNVTRKSKIQFQLKIGTFLCLQLKFTSRHKTTWKQKVKKKKKKVFPFSTWQLPQFPALLFLHRLLFITLYLAEWVSFALSSHPIRCLQIYGRALQAETIWCSAIYLASQMLGIQVWFWANRNDLYRQLSTIHRVPRPSRPDKARRLGYKAKRGYVVYRVRVRRGGRKRPVTKGKTMGKPRNQGVTQLKFARNLRSVAEERVGRACGNLRVLNSYWVNQVLLFTQKFLMSQDSTFKYFEVILVDPSHKIIRQDPRINWICRPTMKHRELRGLTAAGRKGRGMYKKGHLANKLRPSVRASWKRRNTLSLPRFR